MSEAPGAIDVYLEQLRRSVPWLDGWWRRALAEVEDHLRSCAEELSAVAGKDADRDAVERFGPVRTVVGQLAGEYALGLVRRTGRFFAALLAHWVVLSAITRNGPLLTGHIPSPTGSVAVFLLGQLAYAAVAVGAYHAWRLARSPRAAAAEGWRPVRWAGLGLASFGAAILVKLPLVQEDRPLGAGLLIMAAVMALGGLALWRAARRFGLLAPWSGQADGEAAPVGGESALQAACLLAARHPAVFRVLVWVLAGAFAFQLGAMPDGILPGLASAGTTARLLAGGISAAVELAVALAAYAALPRLVERRPAR